MKKYEIYIEKDYMEINYKDVGYSFYYHPCSKKVDLEIYLASEDGNYWVEPFIPLVYYQYIKEGD